MIIVMWFVVFFVFFSQWRLGRFDKLPTAPQGLGGHGVRCAQQCPERVGSPQRHTQTHTHLINGTHTVCLKPVDGDYYDPPHSARCQEFCS